METCQTSLLGELNFFKVFWHFEVFQKFARETEMEEQVIVRLMMVSWLRKMDFK